MTGRNQTANGTRKEKVADTRKDKEARTQKEKVSDTRKQEANTQKEEEIANTRCSVCCDYPVRSRAVADAQATVTSVETYPLASKAKEVPIEWYAVLLVGPGTKCEA